VKSIAVACAAVAAFVGAGLAAAGCDSGAGPYDGLGEPIQTSGQFVPGNLPGEPPPDGGAASGDDGAADGPVPLEIRSWMLGTSEVQPGAQGLGLSGLVTSDAVAVGVALQGLGTGYWVAPVGVPDPSDLTEESFGTTVGFEPTIPAGVHDILLVGIDGSGRGGTQFSAPLCFANVIPDNGHACNPTKQPPGAVMSLHWDSNFDLDLHVVTPDGDDINPKQPYGVVLDSGIHAADPTLPHIDRDSLRNCVPDGLRREDVIFPAGLPRGTYTIYVDPYASCGQAATRFTFTLYESSGTCPHCTFGSAAAPIAGEVLASQVTGGVLTPLEINKIVVP
jgi:hypothetical protein